MVGGVGVGRGLNDSRFQTEQAIFGLTQEPSDTNDEGGRDRVKFRDAISSKNLMILTVLGQIEILSFENRPLIKV